jgi:hypothetical protein
MPTKTKAKKKQTKAKKPATRKKTVAMSSSKTRAKKATKTKAKARARKAVAPKGRTAAKRKVSKKRRTVELQGFSVRRPSVRTASQSGDLQGLSTSQGADSESVAELLEEGNTFEAEVVTGVEAADDVSEVRTHEVPEDDVPDEYLDNE